MSFFQKEKLGVEESMSTQRDADMELRDGSGGRGEVCLQCKGFGVREEKMTEQVGARTQVHNWSNQCL